MKLFSKEFVNTTLAGEYKSCPDSRKGNYYFYWSFVTFFYD